MGRPPASCEGVRNLFPDFASLFSGNLILWGALWVEVAVQTAFPEIGIDEDDALSRIGTDLGQVCTDE